MREGDDVKAEVSIERSIRYTSGVRNALPDNAKASLDPRTRPLNIHNTIPITNHVKKSDALSKTSRNELLNKRWGHYRDLRILFIIPPQHRPAHRLHDLSILELMPYDLILLQADEDHVRSSGDELGERYFGSRAVTTGVPLHI